MRTRCLRRVEPYYLHVDLALADWSAVFNAATVTQKWDSFVAVFMPVVDAHAPVRTVRIRNPSAPTVSDATKALMCRRRGALADFGHGSNEYRDANRAVRSAIRRDSRDDVERRIRVNGRRSMWQLIRSFVTGRRTSRETSRRTSRERQLTSSIAILSAWDRAWPARSLSLVGWRRWRVACRVWEPARSSWCRCRCQSCGPSSLG